MWLTKIKYGTHETERKILLMTKICFVCLELARLYELLRKFNKHIFTLRRISPDETNINPAISNVFPVKCSSLTRLI